MIRFWLTHPRLLYHRVRYAIWQRLHPDAPWFCPGTLSFLEAHLREGMKVFEFGSGRSTAWLAARAGSIVSIEHDDRWYRTTRRRLDERGLRADLRLIPLNHPVEEPERAHYDVPPDYVRAIDGQAPRSLDLVVIDGHYRTHTIAAAIPKIARGGWLLVDDAQFWSDPSVLPIPADWARVNDSSNGLKRAIIWQSPLR